MSGHPVTPSFNGVYAVQPQWPPNSASVLPSGMPYPLIPQSTLASPFFPVNNVHSMGIAPFVNHLPQPFRDATYQESPTKNLHSTSSTLVPSPQQQKSVGALQIQERNLGRESSKSMASNDREEGEWSSNEEAHPPARDAVASQSWPVNKFHPKPNGKPGQDTRLGDSDSRLGPTPSNKEIPNGTRTTTSLRTQAQGALLSLHPHKISYPELVKEGIDSSILRSLYEEVGIKVVDPVLNPVAAVDLEEKRREESSSNNISSQATAALVPQLSQSPKPDFSRQEPRQPELSRPEPSRSEPVPDNSSEFQRTNQLPPESTRTLSRRELIAQKFAAQREKATTSKELDQDKEAAATTAATMEKPLDRNITSNDASNLSSVDPAEKSSIESKAKKSKAQTELAKQRIEQLKMQGIQTRQSRSKPETSAPFFQPSFNTSQSQGVVPAPGLSRPPGNLTTGIPGMSGNSRIPGLFLTTSETMQPQDLKPIDQQISSPQLTNKTRPPKKRPRATDFNEADFEGGQKRQNTLDLRSGYSDRVVIDLSEDEFIYGTDGEERNSLVAEEMPNTNNETYQTPEKSKDAKDGWMNNVPLNELRKLIAEKERLREQKRLASNRCETSTNHSANNSGNDVLSRSQSVEMSNVGEVHDAPCTVHSPHRESHNTITASSSLRPEPVEVNERSQLEEMEVNISMIDAEIAKHEGELAHIQAEEQRLLSEIAKEKNNKNELFKKLEKIRIPPETPRTEETVEPHRQGSPKHVQSEQGIEPGIEAVQSTDKPMQESSLPQTASAITSVEANDTDENPVPTSSLEYQSSGTSSVVHVSTEAGESQNDARIEDTSHSEQVPELSVVQTRGRIPEVFDEHRGEVKQDNFDNQNDLTASRAASLVSDGYEPPESLPAPSEPEYSPPFSPVAPEATESKDMEPTTDSANKNPEALILNSQVPEKQPEPETSQDATAGEWHHFSPYESPLRLFKAYRYHPQFTRTVSGGYRSLTYSHNIDPQKELCAREAVGEDCDDPTCPYQHFRDMYLSDDKILLDISSKREGRTPEEKAQYVEGLKQLVTDMRQRNVNDFNTLATEIAEYRRRFLQDPSRVLTL